MVKFDLCGEWHLEGNGYSCNGTIPGSVCSFLLDNKLIDDPYYRDNELEVFNLFKHDYTFSRQFVFNKPDNQVLLRCDGLDTICDIYLNDILIAKTDNMHRTYEFDVSDCLLDGENKIAIDIHSSVNYVRELQKNKPIIGAKDGTLGFGWLRKANCMFGWDWGPRIPDAGIWRGIYLLSVNFDRITDWQMIQRHDNGKVYLKPVVKTNKGTIPSIIIRDNQGKSIRLYNNIETEIENPKLWWPNGLGEQNLYEVEIDLDGQDYACGKIGLRDIKLIREPDDFGESFAQEVNGIRYFAMGADYIPEDNILTRVTPERSRKLLQIAKDSHFNTIRIWGGGYYPDEFFLDLCDELGICLFFDLMFACTEVSVEKEFVESIKEEIRDNILRIKKHPCITIISGNNEIEEMLEWETTEQQKADYRLLFENIIPELMNEICPEIPFITSSPSTHGGVCNTSDESAGDNHYWAVWHKNVPFTEYRNHHFRYLSEFGFQSFPCEKTLEAVTEPEDRNIFSRVMELHQRNGTANSKILGYLADTYRYPTDFGTLLYASQLLQADAIKYGVEHLRRERGRCMGTLYWQFNDIWPVASWASVDYYGRWKALQYYAKRFYSPILLSCEETGEKDTRPVITMEDDVGYNCSIAFGITNDTYSDFSGEVQWYLRDTDGNVVESGNEKVNVPSMTAIKTVKQDFGELDTEHIYCSYELLQDGKIISEGTTLFTAPKHFAFKDPNLSYTISGNEITVESKAFAKSVEIDSPDSDFVLDDNYFDMNSGSKTVKVLSGKVKTVRIRSVYDIR